MKLLVRDRLNRLRSFASTHKRLVVGFAVVAGLMAAMPVVLLAGNQAVQMVDSTVFCTDTCHSVHYAEAVTIKESPHPSVACAQCHVGTGTADLIKSKMKGLTEILPTLTGNYARPIQDLQKNVVPSAQTCQTCHSPTQYFGDVPVIKTTYATDKSNTRTNNTVVLKLGGGTQDIASGIHWHTTANVWFMATDSQQQDIAWVASESPSGVITQWVNPTLIGQISSTQIQSAMHPMDCVDCHNRVAHPVQTASDLIDQSLANGSIDSNLPYIKLIAVNALNASNSTIKQAYARIDQIKDFYRTNYPSVLQSDGAAIDAAVNRLKDIAVLTTLPNGITPSTYPDEAVHNQPGSNGAVNFAALSQQDDMQGCFRCHGTLVQANTLQATPPVGTPSSQKAIIITALDYLEANLDKTASSGAAGAAANVGNSGIALANSNRGTAGSAVGPISDVNTLGTLGGAAGNEKNGSAPAIPVTVDSNGNISNSLSADCSLCHYAPSTSGGQHALPLAPNVPHPINGLDNCLVCHNPSGPVPFTSTHNWATNGACLTCHTPSTGPVGLPVQARPANAPQIPHATTNLDNCLLCHGPTGPVPFKADHAWVTNDTCKACHTESPNPEPLPQVAPPKAPVIPHSTANLDDCLICHSPSGPKPINPDHARVTNQTCTACHQQSPDPEPIEVVAPANVPQTPHKTDGLADCLVCHAPSGPVPFKADHPWVTDDVCSACHKPSPNPEPMPTVLPPGNVPQIPHSTTGLDACLACHGPNGPMAFKPTHPWVTDQVCFACHTKSPTVITLTPGNLPPAPAVPHSTAGLESCTACHYSGGPAPFAPDHAGRPDSLCLICHKSDVTNLPPASLPTAPDIPHSITGLSSCSMCHHDGGPAPFSPDHAGRPDNFCLICHKVGPSVGSPAADITFYSDPAATQPITTIDMGAVVQGASRSATFYVKNTGQTPVSIYQGSSPPPSGGTLTITFDGAAQETLQPGAIATAVATFQASASSAPGDLNFQIDVSFSDVSSTTPTPNPAVVSYSTTVQPLLNANCIACHGSGGSASVDLTSYSSVMSTAGVIGGNAAGSLLYQSVAGTGVPMMPLGGSLTPDQVAAIQNWINQGAANN